MGINWLLMGYELARLIIFSIITLFAASQLYIKYIQPDIQERYDEAHQTITNLAKLAGVKSQEYTGAKNIEKSVARDIITQQVPELEALKVFVSPSTWEEIEDTIENNPEAIIQLWQKYGHLLSGAAEEKGRYMY